MSAVSNFIVTLMNSRNQTHMYHLMTTSYAEHKALEKYYEGIVPLLDSYAEAYMGTANARVTPRALNVRFKKDPKGMKQYFKDLQARIKKLKLPKESNLKSIQDDIEVLIKSTLYKLTLK